MIHSNHYSHYLKVHNALKINNVLGGRLVLKQDMELFDMIWSDPNKIALIDILVIIDLERQHTQPSSRNNIQEIIARS